ncbi:MAG: replicative DNA helicase [Deltaproteobacteria bacterium]|nr:replicative DNA helicase [Deltaproteobacteria bacterium]
MGYKSNTKLKTVASEPSTDSITGRVPPNSKDAEESVLGGILIDNEAINAALEIIRAEDFYRAAHKMIFQAMIDLTDKREPIDIVTLSSQLKTMNALDDCGGVEYITKLSTMVPTASNVAYYARIVKETALRRRLIHEATEIISNSYSEDNEIEDYLDSVEQRILSVSDYRINPSFHKVGDIVKDSIKHVEKLYDQKELVTGVASGLRDVDKLTAGFQASDLIILAARPSMGKTSLALGIAQNVGIRQNRGVAVFSLEMSKEQLVLRMLCCEARVDSSRVRTGHLGERDFPRLVEAASKIAETPIFIDDTPALTITEMRAKCRRLHREHKLSLIVVDYLQLMRSPAYASTSREQEISDISRSLKALAKELSVPVIALSQLNRSVEARTDKRPMMSDLRESGAIEQDADVICFIYRDEFYNKESEDKGVAELIIAKQRNGPTGTARLAFASESTRFDDLIERDDVGIPAEIEDAGFEFPDLGDDIL